MGLLLLSVIHVIHRSARGWGGTVPGGLQPLGWCDPILISSTIKETTGAQNPCPPCQFVQLEHNQSLLYQLPQLSPNRIDVVHNVVHNELNLFLQQQGQYQTRHRDVLVYCAEVVSSPFRGQVLLLPFTTKYTYINKESSLSNNLILLSPRNHGVNFRYTKIYFIIYTWTFPELYPSGCWLDSLLPHQMRREGIKHVKCVYILI